MSRLDDLRRQRSLIKEQLDWIDREISELTSTPKPVEPPSPIAPRSPASVFAPSGTTPPLPRPLPPSSSVATAPAASNVPEFSQYESDPKSVQQAARRGCLMYAILGFVLFAGLLVAIYFIAYRDRPVFLATPKSAPAAQPPPK